MAITRTVDGQRVQEFVGAVISEREMNGYDDSDFYATVEVQNEDGSYSYKEIMVGTTRGYMDVGCAVDATPEVLARYQAHQEAIRKSQRAAKADVDGHLPVKGMMAYVTGGRKHRGKSGRVVWEGASYDARYASKYRNEGLRKAFGIYSIDLDCRDGFKRVGILTDSGEKVFVDADQVDCFMDPAEDVSDAEWAELVPPTSTHDATACMCKECSKLRGKTLRGILESAEIAYREACDKGDTEAMNLAAKTLIDADDLYEAHLDAIQADGGKRTIVRAQVAA